MRAVVESCRREATAIDGHDPLDEAALLHLRHHGLLGTTAWLAGEDAHDGFALRRAGSLDLVVRPGARRRGLGAALAAAALVQDVGPAGLSAWSHGDHPAAARLAAAYDASRVRELWVMRLPLAGAAAGALPALAVPDDVTLRSWGPEEDHDVEDLLALNAAAFVHHPEQGSLDRTGLEERIAEDWFDPAGLILAHDASTGRLLGFHWTKQHSPALGEVYVVGIDPEAQGRGLGKVLTLAGLHHLAGLGVGEILLYVESDNAPAVAVYAGLGFTHADADTHVMYQC